MKRAYEYRESAWNILRGRYWWAVLAGLIASVLGGFSSNGWGSFSNRYNESSFTRLVENVTNGRIDAEQLRAIMHPFSGFLASIAGLILVYAIAIFIVGSAVELGYNRFNISLYESSDAPKIETLFSRFSYFGNAFSLRLLMFVKTLLWSLLFVIPGIEFRVVDMLITNFHLPKSTLLMLVSAFGGMDEVCSAYRHAIAAGYRFFSYGDAMLLHRASRK